MEHLFHCVTYGVSKEGCIKGLVDFDVADAEPDPICLQGKIWQLIKLDFAEWISEFTK